MNLCTNALACTTCFDYDLGQAWCVQVARKASRLTTCTAASQEASSPPQPPERSTRAQHWGASCRQAAAAAPSREVLVTRSRCQQQAAARPSQLLKELGAPNAAGAAALAEVTPRYLPLFSAHPCRCTAALASHIPHAFPRRCPRFPRSSFP